MTAKVRTNLKMSDMLVSLKLAMRMCRQKINFIKRSKQYVATRSMTRIVTTKSRVASSGNGTSWKYRFMAGTDSLANMKTKMKVDSKLHKRGRFSVTPVMNGRPCRLTTKTVTCWTLLTKNTTVFSIPGLNVPSRSTLKSSGKCCLARCTATIMVTK